MSNQITIATCQYAVTENIENNLRMTLKLMQKSKASNPDVVHFSECNLTGYAGIDFKEYSESQQERLVHALAIIRKKAAELGLSVIIGSHHFKTGISRPLNSLLFINKKGVIEKRYDKRWLAGAEGESDKKYYSPGKDAVVFNIKGTQCGLLICHEWRYPELYREYQRMGVKIIFQSWYDGNLSKADYNAEGMELGSLIMGTVRGNAANNHLWISGSNTSKRESSFGSFLVQPDGRIKHSLKRNYAGVLISKIDPDKKFQDPSYFGRIQLNKINQFHEQNR